jgi:hypothetical protein
MRYQYENPYISDTSQWLYSDPELDYIGQQCAFLAVNQVLMLEQVG